MYEFKKFEHLGKKLRIVIVDGKELYFVATDVVVMLGLNAHSTTQRMLQTVPENERIKLADLLRTTGDTVLSIKKKATHTQSGGSGVNWVDIKPFTTLVTESGLYRLTMRSDKPNAKKFQDWVCEEVLPTLRKTGRYEIPQMAQELSGMVQSLQDGSKKLQDSRTSHKVAHIREGFTFEHVCRIGEGSITLSVTADKNTTAEKVLRVKHMSSSYFDSLTEELIKILSVKQ